MIIKFIDRSQENSVEGDVNEYAVEAQGYKVERHWFNSHADLGEFLESHPPFNVPFGLEAIKGKDGRSVIDLSYRNDQGQILGWIVAQRCTVFIMNDQGKTIDTYRAH